MSEKEGSRRAEGAHDIEPATHTPRPPVRGYAFMACGCGHKDAPKNGPGNGPINKRRRT